VTIEEIKRLGERLRANRREIRQKIEVEDYEGAKMLKMKIENIKV
jgi:hypothetical protein